MPVSNSPYWWQIYWANLHARTLTDEDGVNVLNWVVFPYMGLQLPWFWLVMSEDYDLLKPTKPFVFFYLINFFFVCALQWYFFFRGWPAVDTLKARLVKAIAFFLLPLILVFSPGTLVLVNVLGVHDRYTQFDGKIIRLNDRSNVRFAKAQYVVVSDGEREVSLPVSVTEFNELRVGDRYFTYFRRGRLGLYFRWFYE